MRAFLKELRRRRVFRTAAIYVVSAWLVMQVAEVLFPGWDIPEAAIRYLFWAAVAGFPIALIFGWMYDIGSDGIRRTKSADAAITSDFLKLQTSDYLLLAAFTVVSVAILYNATVNVLDETEEPAALIPIAEKIENSIAVLPFANLSTDPGNEHFGSAIAEEIRHKLGEFRDLYIIGRTSSDAFKDSDFDIPKLSSILRVRYLLQGSVQKEGNQLRISTQLVDDTGVHVWSSRYDREDTGIFAIQVDIAESVATSIAPHLSDQRLEESPRNIEAYQHYLIGREILAKRLSGFPVRAPEEFQQAIEIDPQFAEPYAEMAIAWIIGSGISPDSEAQLEMAQQAIDTALSLRPDFARAYAAQGLLLSASTSDDDSVAEEALRKALALDPNSVDVLTWLSQVLNSQGRGADALNMLERAVQIDPLAPAVNVNIASFYMRQGEFDRAESRLLPLLDVPQPSAYVFTDLITIYRSTGRLFEAVQLAKESVLAQVETDSPWPTRKLANSYAHLGSWDAAKIWLDFAQRRWPDSLALRLGRLEFQRRRGRFAEMERQVEAVVELSGGNSENLNPFVVPIYGTVHALSGDYAAVIEVLEPVVKLTEIDPGGFFSPTLWDENHALAWAYLQTGAVNEAKSILEACGEFFGSRESEGQLHRGPELLLYARNTLLLGDKDLALDRLRRAIDAGWRDYYNVLHDPMWDSIRDNPVFQELMAMVKADLDAQRERVEQIDAEDDFVTIFDQAIAARR